MILEDKLLHLISVLSEIRNKYEREIRLNGYAFNVFEILRLSTNEVRTHSAFLGELLNFRGSHGQGVKYLELFIQHFNIADFDCLKSITNTEKFIGYISNDKTVGGSIDIIVRDLSTSNAFIIENKINAKDQENQLLRYYNYANKYCRTAKLFYLTLDGREPDKFTKGELSSLDYCCISYSHDIKGWLLKCLDESEKQPIIRETLNQYIMLIDKLTGQSSNTKMNKEIVNKIFENDSHLVTFFEMHNSNLMVEVQRKLIERLKDQMSALADELNLKLTFDKDFGFKKETQFYFEFRGADCQYIFSFGFCYFFERLVYGVYSKNKIFDTKHSVFIAQRLGDGLGWGNALWVGEMEPDYLNWNNNALPWLAIMDNALKESIREKLVRLYESTKDLVSLQ